MLNIQQARQLEPKVTRAFKSQTGLPIGAIGLVPLGDGGYGFDITLHRRPEVELPQTVEGVPIRYKIFEERPELLSFTGRRDAR